MIVVPYVYYDGIWTFRDSEIISLYNKIYEEGSGYMFMDGQIKNQDDFLAAMKKSIVGIVRDGNHIAGIGWLNRIETKKATSHFVLFKKYWGKGSDGIGRSLCKYMLSIQNDGEFMFDVIWGLTPKENRFAVRYLKKCGAVVLGELPYGIWDERNKKSIPAVISYITRDQL